MFDQALTIPSRLETVTWRHWPLLLMLVIALPFLLIRLGEVPHTWFDEGLILDAARTLAETGQYALPSGDDLRLADPAIQSGPPLVIPIALLYKLFGDNLTIIRLLMVGLGLMTLTTLYILAYRMYGRFAAVLTLVVLILMPGETTANVMMMSRQVLGEIPSILCITLGIHIMLRPKPTFAHHVLVGVLFGLAVALKSQVLLVLSATCAVMLIYSLWKRIGWQRWITITVVMGVVYSVDVLWRAGMAGDQLASNSAVLRDGVLIHILPFRWFYNLTEPGALVRLIFMIGTAWAVVYVRRSWPEGAHQSGNERRTENFALAFVVLWALWFAFVSIGWRRYAFVGQVFTIPLLSSVISAYWRRRRWPEDGRVLLALSAACLIGAGVMYLPDLLNDRQGSDFTAMSGYLEQKIPDDAVIVTWEWSAAFFTDHRFTYPPTEITNEITREAFLRVRYDLASYNPLADCPAYVLLGTFDLDRKVLADALAVADPTPVFSQGMYQLYAIPESRLERQLDGSCVARAASVSN